MSGLFCSLLYLIYDMVLCVTPNNFGLKGFYDNELIHFK